jgi:uncharacterized membrane protein YeaQ/YmgE (transglycosylase-associated protein family)
MFAGTNEQQGLIANIIVGVVGAVIGGYIMKAVGGQGVTGFNLPSFLVAVLGAFILLVLVRVLF